MTTTLAAQRVPTLSHPSDDSGYSELDVLIRARLLLLIGFAPCICEIETGLTQKRIRRIRRDMLDEGLQIANIRPVKKSTSRSLIVTKTQQQQASVLMATYASLHDGYTQEVDPFALGTAYGLFLAAMEASGISTAPDVGSKDRAHAEGGDEDEDAEVSSSSDTLLSINGAWSLAAELRSQEASLIECMQCGTKFFEAVHQHYLGDHPCPWCG